MLTVHKVKILEKQIRKIVKGTYSIILLETNLVVT